MDNQVENSFEYLRKYLPKQGPLEFFVHHNTFHELEDLPFKKALNKGQQLYQGKVLKCTEEYKKDYSKGKIDKKILENIIADFLKSNNLHDDKYMKFCQRLLTDNPVYSLESEFKHNLSSLLKKSTEKNWFFKKNLQINYGIDIDEIISPIIFRFLSAYFDQGVSYWKMPERSSGMLSCFNYNYSKTNFFSSKWEKELSRLLLEYNGRSPKEIISSCLKKIQIKDQHQNEYLFNLCLRYKGWSGLILSFEQHPEWNKRKDVTSSFEEFTAILILCETAYISSLNVKKQKKLLESTPIVIKSPIHSKKYLFHASAILANHGDANDSSYFKIVELFTDFERSYLMHLAYEESFYKDFISSFKNNQKLALKSKTRPSLQVLCCIDDREESFRRHLEYLGSDIETFGIAGHFGLDISYKGIFDAHYRALCPDIISPSKKIEEKLESGAEAKKFFSLWASYLWMQSISSRTLVRGIFFQIMTGIIAIFSLSLAVISPYLTFKIRSFFKNKLDKKLKTSLSYEAQNGLSFEQMVSHSESLFQTIGLKENIAPVVAILGHGSHSLNNPHESAYNCGACGGGRSAPNARLMAHILNRNDIRQELKKKELHVPEDTTFVGGYHNTCSNEVLFFDIPDRNDVKSEIKRIREASRIDAFERCRKFEDVPLNIEIDSAYLHCLGRANNYMQARPEYNHATNALCYVGPRWMSKNLFLDRRAFLTSYEPDLDTENTDILKNILSAVGPVCSGINLEYYFSTMDNDVYGCGTKLPHNITSLVGVMNGYQSDLLMGLNSQMVEIHEPYRLMLLVVCEVEKMKKVIKEIHSLDLLVSNDWIHLCVFDQKQNEMFKFKDGHFFPDESQENDLVSYESPFETFKNKREVRRLGVVRKS